MGTNGTENLLNKDYSFTTGNKTGSQSVSGQKVSKNPVSIINTNSNITSGQGDEATFKLAEDNAKKGIKTKKHVTAADIEQKISEIEKKCRKYNISFESLRKRSLQGMNISLSQFSKLSYEEQYVILTTIESNLEIHTKRKQQGKIAKDVNLEEFVAQVTKNSMSASKLGITNIKEFQQYVTEVAEETIKKYKNAKSDNERAEILQKGLERIKKKANQELENSKKGKSEAERAKLNKHHKKMERAYENAYTLNVAASLDTENRKDAVYASSPNNLDEATKITIDISDEESKAIVADSQDHEFYNNYLQFQYEHGYEVPADAYGNAIAYSMQFKTEEAATQFAEDALTFRQKVENGEIDAPWITKEHLTAQAEGISAGISANSNITSDTKTALLNKWDTNTNSTANNNSSNEKLNQYIPSNNNVATKPENSYNSAKGEQDDEVTIVNYKASKKEIEDALSSSSFAVVKKKYPQNSDKELVEAILHNPKLKIHKVDVISYLKSYSADDLYSVTRGCSSDIFCFVLRNISPEKAGKLYDLSKKDQCYTTRELGEKIVEEGKQDEAA